MKSSILISLFWGSSLFSVAYAAPPREIELTSAENTRVSLAYTTHTVYPNGAGGRTVTVDSLAVKLSGGLSDFVKSARVVVLSVCRSEATGRDYWFPPAQIELEFEQNGNGESGLTGVLGDSDRDDKPIVLKSSYRSSTECRNEIAVTVNDRWLTDPINGTHNFVVKFEH
jgi:hypothetical protein